MNPTARGVPARPRAADLEALTPADRNRVVDLVRVGALLVVVLGHWVMQGLWVTDAGVLRRTGMLSTEVWAHPFTWLLQVVPLFFLVGGYVNALSWRRGRERGLPYGEWLAARTARLVRPLLPLLAFWVVAAPGAGHLGLGWDWLRVAGKASWVPTWFLAVYLVVVALTPLTLAWWERSGLRTVLAGVLLAGAVDLVGLVVGGTAGFAVGTLNVLVVWTTLHQLGYAWRDGAVGGQRHRGRAALLVAGALLAAVLLVRLGPYGVSMVGVTGHGVDNSIPPKVTLLLVGLAQVGAVLLLEPRLARVAARPRVWRVTALVGSRMMTVYLWHLTAFGLLAAASLGLDGAGMSAEPGSAAWWWSRPAWFLLLALTAALLVVLLGRFEPVRTRVAAGAPGTAGVRGAVAPLLEVLVVCVVVAALARGGVVDAEGRAVWEWQAFGLAALLLLGAGPVTGSRRLRPGRRSDG
ncbi:acyltransferase family protein [Nocardioides solisilvae]|uniref:acyltransferase family protein n=1 Tax=Nocardioides solisilvae TaxID=1542435 RepID=UPI000D74D815|nr:acyltransferase [Nocardioides solisilvae]